MHTPEGARTPRFDERRWLPRAVGLPLLIFTAACLAAIPFLWGESDAAVPKVLLVVCLGCIPVLISSLHSRVTIANDFLVLALAPVWRRRVKREHVAAVRPREIRARDMGGLGLRRTTDGALGLVMRGRNAVELTTTDGRTYVLGTDRSEELAAALRPPL